MAENMFVKSYFKAVHYVVATTSSVNALQIDATLCEER